MANSASFIIGKTLTTDKNCFAIFRNSSGYEEYIVIEKEKFCFSRNVINSFLDDLIKIGYNISYKFNKKEQKYLINITKVEGYMKRVSLCMLIRFLWEGYYKNKQHSSYYHNYDNFTLVLKHYFNVKKLKPKENKLLLLCIACNSFIKSGVSFNSNHFLSYKECKLINDLNSMKGEDVNTFFNTSKFTIEKNILFSTPEKCKKKDYLTLFKEINYE